jgi:hypothetical protein
MFATLGALGANRYRAAMVNFETTKGRKDMTHLARIAALIAVFAAAGCTVSAEVAQTSPAATEASSLYGEMHNAIPASRTSGNVFEYSSDVGKHTPVATNTSWVYAQGNVFEYN